MVFDFPQLWAVGKGKCSHFLNCNIYSKLRCHSLQVFGFFFQRSSERRVLLIVGVCFASSHLRILLSSHLRIFSSSHLFIFASFHLLIFASSHLLIITSLHPHIFASSHFLIVTFSHLLIFKSSHLHISSLSFSCFLAFLLYLHTAWNTHVV